MSARAREHRARPSRSTGMMAVLVKEFIQLTRDRLTYAMILAVPVIQMLLFGYAINTDPRHLPTAVLVQENSVFARSVVSRHRQHLLFRHHPPGAHARPSSTRLVRTGEVQFAITIPGDFTRRVVRGDRAQILVEADATDPTATGSALAALAAPAAGGAAPRPDRRAARARPSRRRRSRWSSTAATIRRTSPPTTSSPACSASC